jgi:DNA-binding NarL/FixJ family response regulator
MTNRRILIIEDEMIIARDIERCLKEVEATDLRIANSSLEALEIARQFRPELVLLDINLKEEKDGVAIARAIQNILHTEIIYITAHGNPSTIKKALTTQPMNYIIKPFSREQVKVAVKVALQNIDSQEHLGLPSGLLNKLTPAERKIIRLIAKNKTSVEIAELLFLSPKTVENHRYHICKKLKLSAVKNSLIRWVYAHKSKIGEI